MRTISASKAPPIRPSGTFPRKREKGKIRAPLRQPLPLPLPLPLLVILLLQWQLLLAFGFWLLALGSCL
jgi:hypothetical protein